MLIDTHSHLNFPAFKNDLNKIIKQSLSDNVWMINVGTDYQTSKKAVEIAEKYEKGIYAAIGLHPINLDVGLVKIKIDPSEFEEGYSFEKEFDFKKYKNLAKNPKVKAIGEIGLDYYWKPKTKKKLDLFKEKQRELLLKQLELSEELNLPMILHCRFGHDNLLGVLKSNLKGVIHCFTGNWEQTQKYLSLGFYLGFNGIIFKLNLDEIIKKIPLDRILIETDCPYLTPPQKEGQRNEPLYIKYVVQKIAEVKNISFEKVAEITTKNAKELFKLE